jgi:hypothetical protein
MPITAGLMPCNAAASGQAFQAFNMGSCREHQRKGQVDGATATATPRDTDSIAQTRRDEGRSGGELAQGRTQELLWRQPVQMMDDLLWINAKMVNPPPKLRPRP